MPVPFRMQREVLAYILRQRIRGARRYPLVLMLEPLFACNLECAGCGKVRHPPELLGRRLSPEQCWQSAEECGAPIVSVAGGEPLLHPEIGRIVEGFVQRRKFVYLCTNALLWSKKMRQFQPSPYLVLSIHLDGLEETHDRVVGKEGAYRTAVEAVRAAKRSGFCVMTNTTVFRGGNPEEFRRFFDSLTAMGVDGLMISPGYAYENAHERGIFLSRQQTQAWFQQTLRDWRRKGWPFNHTPFYLDFLEGKRNYDCSPWGNPLRNVLGWQKPCYLLSEMGYAGTYRELLETTDWSRFGYLSGNPKCAHCMVHSGYEPSAAMDAFSTPWKVMRLVWDYLSIRR